MKIGVPKEIKVHEYRVGLTPASVRELVEAGHEVLVQTGAAAGIGFTDADYQRVGAKIAAKAEEIFAQSEMIVKVKEPAAGRMRDAAQGPGPVHLPAPRAGPEAGRGADQVRGDLHRLRDGVGPRRFAAPPHAHEEVAGRMSVQEFTVNHAKRNQLKMTLGRSATTTTTPTTNWTPAALQTQGGSYAFDGTTTAVDGSFVLDFSDILVEGAGTQRYYLSMSDSLSGDIATLRAYKLVDLTTNPATETVCGAVPQTVDGTTLPQQINAY